jgi:hypothetical protein
MKPVRGPISRGVLNKIGALSWDERNEETFEHNLYTFCASVQDDIDSVAKTLKFATHLEESDL